MKNFFEEYYDFTTSSVVGNSVNRLVYRHNLFMDSISFKDKTVLDLGSHDGRWSFAAAEKGAKSVTSVEYNKVLLEKAELIREKYAWSNVEFIEDDNLRFLKNTDRKFDIILCCGVFYHTMNHLEYFNYMSEACREAIILDTNVWPSKDAMVYVTLEKSSWDGNSYRNTKFNLDDEHRDTIAGIPSESYIQILAKSFGLEHTKLDYPITNQQGLGDYVMKQRCAYILRPELNASC